MKIPQVVRTRSGKSHAFLNPHQTIQSPYENRADFVFTCQNNVAEQQGGFHFRFYSFVKNLAEGC